MGQPAVHRHRQGDAATEDPKALAALGYSAMLLSLGASPQADEYEHRVKRLARAA